MGYFSKSPVLGGEAGVGALLEVSSAFYVACELMRAASSLLTSGQCSCGQVSWQREKVRTEILEAEGLSSELLVNGAIWGALANPSL